MKVIEQEIAALKNTINEMWALVHQHAEELERLRRLL